MGIADNLDLPLESVRQVVVSGTSGEPVAGNLNPYYDVFGASSSELQALPIGQAAKEECHMIKKRRSRHELKGAKP